MDTKELLKRLKSFGWRMLMLFSALVVKFVFDNLGLFNLPNEVTVILGLILGEISKMLNKQHQVNLGIRK